MSCRIPKNVIAVINQRIMRITTKKYDNEVLSLLLNSIVGAYQLERVGTGGVQTNISGNDILKIIIPIMDIEIQETISEKIQESFRLKTQSEQLLEIAKLGVEKAIENDEDFATKWINEELTKNNISL